MSNEKNQLSGNMAYSAPPYWKLRQSDGGDYIGFNSDVVKYPLFFLSAGVLVLGIVAWQNEEVRNLLSLTQWVLVLLLLLTIPCALVTAAYVIHWRGPRWLIYQRGSSVLNLPRRAMAIPVEKIVAIQSLSGYYGFRQGYHRRWVSELRVIYREESRECIVSIVGTTQRGVTEDAAQRLAHVLQTEVMIEEAKNPGT